MYTKNQLKKIDRICRMILEVSNGNFSYKIERSDHADHLEPIVVSLNMMAEEIRESFHHFAMINPHETYRQTAHMSFTLDHYFRIVNYNSSAIQFLKTNSSSIHGQHLSNFLSRESRQLWTKKIKEIRSLGQSDHFHTLRLIFISKNDLTLPSLCTLSSLVRDGNRDNYILTAVQTLTESLEKEKKVKQILENSPLPGKKTENHHLKREADKKKIQDIYDYILENLDKPLPSLRDLAHQHGINEFKLKVGFRQLYNTSVFRFQKDQRLKRAHNFIIDSDLSLSRIAGICGFKSFSHFSKIFKKKYGYNPSDVRKKV